MKKVILKSAFVATITLTASCSQIKSDIQEAVEQKQEVVKTTLQTSSYSKKYDIKSGIVTYEIEIKMGKINVPKEKVVLYFDDYGITERKDTYKKGELATSEVAVKDGNRYVLNHNKKTYNDLGQNSRGWEYKVDWNEISEDDKAKGKAKKLPNETILKKDCETYIYNGNMKVAGWKGVLLLSEMKTESMTSTQKAISFEEVKVPADKFQIPGTYTKK